MQLTPTSPNNVMASQKPLLLEIKNLRTYFHLVEGTARAVDGVDLVIRRGQTLGLVGESGCGKSVTALSILRIVPSPGKIEDGKILYHRSPRHDRAGGAANVVDLVKLHPDGKEIRSIRGNDISMIFQEPMTAFSPVLTVGQQITEAIILHQHVSKTEARHIAIDMLARVKVPKPEQTFDDYPFQLSGGMRQRAIIAMALCCHPSLLIADEPTTALDVTTEAQILELLRELQQDLGMTIIYITHNLGVIAEMAEEVAVMYMGRIVEQAPVSTIFFDPKHPYTRGLLRSVPKLGSREQGQGRRRLETIPGMVPDPYSMIPGCPFYPRCAEHIDGLCNQVEPSVIEVDPGHTARCHLYNR